MDNGNPAYFGGIGIEHPSYDRSAIVILPIPFDLTATWQKGAARGPAAVIDASHYLEFYDIETNTEVITHGIHTLPPLFANDPDAMIREAYARTAGLLADGKFVVTLGGEHSVSIGPAWAHADRFHDVSILQFDAHTDLRDEYHGSRYNHACTMARIREKAPHTIAVGIRSMDASERSSMRASDTFFAHDIHAHPQLLAKVLKQLGRFVYVTIDVDVFDTGIMPATGTPEPGGLGWYEVMGLLREVAHNRQVVGFDVTELCPSWNGSGRKDGADIRAPHDNRAPDFFVAKLMYQFLSYIYFFKKSE